MRSFVALDPAVASASATANKSDVRLMLNAIRQYFVLGITPSDVSPLLDEVRALPADLQFIWTEVLKARLGRTDLTIAAHSNGIDCRLPHQSARDVPQVVDSQTLAKCPACGSTRHPWSTLFSSPMANSCANQQSLNVLPRGTTRTEAYDRALKAIAQVSNNCIIVDRYAGLRLVRHGDTSGMSWLGAQLVRDGVQRVVLVTSSTGTSSGEIASAASTLSNASLRGALRIEVCPDNRFRDSAHDRFVMLQAGRTGCTYSIGKGLEVFEQEVISQESSFSSSDGASVARTLQRLGVDTTPHLI